MTRKALVLGAAAVAGLFACTGDVEVPTTTTGEDAISFEEFEANTYKEPWADGVYIVNGDTPIVDIKALEEFWASLYGEGALIVHQTNGQDAKWNSTQKKQLTYCVSTNFGSRYNTAVTAMSNAAAAWEQVADVDFIHVSAQDSNCTASNTNVLFDVRPVSGQPYVARAFFPGNPRSSRNVLIDSSAWGNTGSWTATGVIRHELGHVLGFRHEHTRPEAGTCFEDNSWRPLTSYDSYSVMHYPQCNGSQTGDLVITTKDAQGAAALYGSPGGGGGGEDPPPPPPPPGGVERTGSDGPRSIARYQWINYQPQSVVAGTRYTVVMTGSGDPDLYVRWGARPTASQWNCRPYLYGAAETCDIDVPAGVTQAYFSVYGYTSGTYTVNVTWTSPN